MVYGLGGRGQPL